MNPLSESDLGEGGFYFSTDYGLVFIWEYGNPGSVPMIGVNDEVQQLKLKSRSDTHMAKSEVGDEVGFVYASAEYTATLNLTIKHICSRAESCGETTYVGTITVTDNAGSTILKFCNSINLDAIPCAVCFRRQPRNKNNQVKVMRWIPLLLTPIAVRNSFGMCAFLLYKAGVFWPYTQLGKHVAFLFGMGVAIAAYRRYYTGYLLTYGAFFLGIVSSIIAIYFAVSVGSHMALALASLWIILFALSLYLSVRDASTLRSTVSA